MCSQQISPLPRGAAGRPILLAMGRVLAVLLLLSSCDRHHQAPTPAPAPRPPAGWWTLGAAACPAETVLRGAAPPSGTALWCESAPGTREGPYASWHSGDRAPALEALGLYRQGRRYGLWVRYYDDGARRLEQRYDRGALDGPQRSYYRDGTLATEGRFRAGLPDGVFRAYDRGGHLAGESQMRAGTGTMVEWAPDGWKVTAIHYVDGVRTGRAVRYREDGSVAEEGQYLTDMKQGLWIERGADGQVVHRARYERGQRVEERQ